MSVFVEFAAPVAVGEGIGVVVLEGRLGHEVSFLQIMSSAAGTPPRTAA